MVEDIYSKALMAVDNYRYRLDSELFRNPSSRRRFKKHPPSLSDAQLGVVDQLREHGIALVSFDELFAGRAEAEWEKAASAVDSFVCSERVRRGVEELHNEFARWIRGGCNQKNAPPDFVARQFGSDGPVDPADAILRLALDPLVVDTVNAFLQLWSKLREIDIEYRVPCHIQLRPRKSAQTWHRDEWEQLKVFLYFSDVDEESGALEYIPGSRRGGPFAHLWPLPEGRGADGYLHPPDHIIAEAVTDSDRILCAGPRGTMVFCDTAGIHRGGFARSRARVLASWAFYAPAAFSSRGGRCFHLARPPQVGSLSEAAAYAIG
ncbi:MAG: phytanoyl-CoA dioxygenase family protein [Blastocatellia bacterium]|nr:phytanoyl-CoA dioxygenase family protein [Blastocatellia bacterium]